MSDVPNAAIRRQIIVLIPVFMNTLMIGCAAGWIPNAVYFFQAGKEVHASSSQRALIISCAELGRLVFAIPSGMLADKYGRKKIIWSAALLEFFVWLVLSLNTSMCTILAGRFIIGMAQALINATSLISVGEISSPQIRATLSSIYQIFMNTGPIIPSITCIAFSSYKLLNWSITFLAILTLLSMYWATETPSFLISASKFSQAKINLQKIRQGYTANDIDVEFKQLQKYIEDEQAQKNQLNWIQFLKSKSIRKPMLVGIISNFFSVATGTFIIRAYITIIIPSNEIIPTKYYPLILQLIILITSFSTPLYADKFPRRSIFLVGTALTIVITAFTASSHYFIMEYWYDHIFKWIFASGNILIVICYTLSVQPMTNTLNAELYPQAVKGFCGSLVIISQASALVISYQLFHLIETYFHIYVMYIICSFNSIMLYLVVYFFLPEGRGAFLSDLQMKFKEECLSNVNNDVEKNSKEETNST